MIQPIYSPSLFAKCIKKIVPGAYREVTAQDVRDMTECGLIGCYGRYYRNDIETVRGILRYEQLQQERNQRSNAIRTCKRCGNELTSNNGSVKGRPKEYCDECESFRGIERWRRWYIKKNF